jgi:Tfp pilus assembly protein PilO
MLIAPRRSTAADLRAQDVSAQQSNQVLRARIEDLRVQFGKLPEQRAKLDEIKRQLPPTVDMPVLLRAVDSLTSSSGVTLSSFAPGEPSAVTATGTSAASGTSGTSATSGKDSPGLYSIPVSIVVSGDYFQSVAFLRQLQTGMPRAMLVTGLQITKGTSDGNDVQVTITGQVFTRTATVGTPTPAPSAPAGSPAVIRETSPAVTTAASPAVTATVSPAVTATAPPVASTDQRP